MALSEKNRNRFYEHFVEHVGEEAAEAMLSQFPSRDADEPATKDFVLSQAALLRSDMAQMETRLSSLISGQTDRFMNRVQVTIGVALGLMTIVNLLTR